MLIKHRFKFKRAVLLVIAISIVLCAVSVFSSVELVSTNNAYQFAEELRKLDSDAEYRLIIGSNKRINTLGAVGTACGPNGTYVLQYDSEESAKKAYDYYNSLSYIIYVEYDRDVFNAYCSVEGGYEFKAKCSSTVVSNTDDAIKLIKEVKGNDLPEIRVAVIDSGIARTSITNKRIDGGNTFVDGYREDGTTIMSNAASNAQHGTKVAGTIIQNTLENVRLYSYQVIKENGSIKLSYVISSIYLAVENECKVISMSIAFNKTQTNGQSSIEAVNYATENGCICIAGAGNDSTSLENSTIYPALCENAITVGAVGPNKVLCSFSNYGKGVDIYATGKSMTTYDVNGFEDTTWSGTSAATPVISSICALLLEIKPDITIDEIKELLIKTGTSTNENEMNDSHRLIADAYGCVKELTGQELETCDLDFKIEGETIAFSSDTENAEIYYFNNLGGSIEIPYKDNFAENSYKATLNQQVTAKNYVVIACAYAPGKAKSKVELLKIPVYDYEFGYLINEASATNKYNTFSRCEITDEKTMIVPEKINGIEVQEIGKYCYMGNQNVETIILPETVKQIDYYAFANCPKLKTVIAPGVEYCERYAFYDCPNLRNVEIPLVTEINTALFKNCTSLTCLDIGDIETVYNHGLKNCSLDLNNKEHNYEVACCNQANKDTIVSFECTKCENKYTENFTMHINKNYPPLDVNNDGIVNAKDFARILKQ